MQMAGIATGILVGIALAALLWQVRRTAVEAEGLVRGLRETVPPTIAALRRVAEDAETQVRRIDAVTADLRTMISGARETFEVYNRGLVKPAVWAASLFSAVRGMAGRFKQEAPEDDEG